MSEPSAPLVTIVTPTFDHRRYIGKCLSSVLEQSEARWEQIVVDDGSTDGTDSVVRAFGDPRIRLIRREHSGIMHLADSYNEALAAARGRFVAVLEGDDFWPPYKLEHQLRAFERPDVVLSWGRAAETDAAGRVRRLIPDARLVTRMQSRSRGETIRSLLAGNYIPACTVVCRRDALQAIGGFVQPHGIPNVDFPTWLELGRVGSFAPLETVLGYYRRHPDQVTARMTVAMFHNVGWGTRFVEQLPNEERSSLGLSVAAARRIERETRAAVQLLAGRGAARDGQAADATIRFRHALRHGGRATRLKALVALACLCTPLDLEAMFESGARVARRCGGKRDRFEAGIRSQPSRGELTGPRCRARPGASRAVGRQTGPPKGL